MDVAELVLHPVRLRIVQVMADGAPATTAQLAARLPDVSTATVYRQVATLLAGGLLEVAGEERVRGAVERSYRLIPARTLVDGAAMDVEDHRRGFTAAVASLLAEFGLYLDGDAADPHADGVSYRQFPLWLDAAEKAALVEEVAAAIGRRAALGPGPGRRPHLLATILFPRGGQTAPN